MASDTKVQEETNLGNGLLLSNTYFPEEVMLNILVHVPWKDLLTCRLVCQTWRRLIDYPLSTDKLERFSPHTFNSSFYPAISRIGCNSVIDSGKIPFFIYYKISTGLFVKNLLENPFGSGKEQHVCEPPKSRWSRRKKYIYCASENCPRFKGWTITESEGNGWTVETTPVGSQPLPEHLGKMSCFVTSYGPCVKHQLIDLSKAGLSHKVMDAQVVPHIEVSEWYAGRSDCGFRYSLKVSLLDMQKKIVKAFEVEFEGHQDDKWNQVMQVFKDYGPGVRFIRFEHSGVDTQFWAGHYGAKIAGGSVVVRIPLHLYQTSEESS